MNPTLVIGVIGAYFALLLVVAQLTGRNGSNSAFFTGNRNSPWLVVAFGMIGASLSGVTFISVPGWVKSSGFGYFQMVLGYLVGYVVIAGVLIPLYYRLGLSSIYGYLLQRFGPRAYHTGSAFFLLSKTIGAAFRLYLVAVVLQVAVFDALGVPFWITVFCTLGMIWAYTFQAGIKTIVWTDMLQTAFMLLALVLTIYLIGRELNLGLWEVWTTVYGHEYAQVFFWDWQSNQFFAKQFLSGAFIAIVMTGLDQDMMQKNLSCRSTRESQKNVLWLSVALVPVNLLFLSLGVLLYFYAQQQGIELPAKADDLYPMLAIHHLGTAVGVIFVLGVIAAAFSSADSALAALTTAFCIDFLGHNAKEFSVRENSQRRWVHIGFSALLFGVIVGFRALNDDSVIGAVFTAAGYTYGPLLGLFAFGLFTSRRTVDRWVPFIALASPVFSYWLAWQVPQWLDGYRMGYELLIFNGLFTFAGLWLASKPENVVR